MQIRRTGLALFAAAWRIAAGWVLGAWTAPALDGGFADWRAWLGGIAFGVSILLFWGGVARIPLPRLPGGIHDWSARRRHDEWERRNAPLAEPGRHEVVMDVLGDRWIYVIRALRQATGMTLAEAKDATAEPHSPVVSSRSEAAAELIAAELRRAGATAVVRPMAD